jgi:poly-gamma-glutamate capsule biosynthesis protein CapA/YwtB (metallophosphatase superfamily)
VRQLLRAIALTSIMLLLALSVSSTAPRTETGSPPDWSAVAHLDTYPWLYLRDGRHLSADEATAELIAVGDVMLARGVAEAGKSGRDPFSATAAWLRSADLALGNLECAVAAEGTPRPGPYRLHAPVSAAAALRDAGFDVVSLANNHALDLGPEGLAEAVSRLNQAGVATVGAGRNQETARMASVVDAGGLRIAFLAFNAVPDPQDYLSDSSDWTVADWNRESLLETIAAMKTGPEQTRAVDAIVVSAHWGFEYELRPDPSQRRWAEELLEAGADLVLGHHPHVVQGTEMLNGGFVAYSLGNFLFDQEQGETRQGLALRAFFDAQGLRAVQALPVWAGRQPRLMRLEDGAPLLERVYPANRTTNTDQQHTLNGGTPKQPTPSGAPERSVENGNLTEPTQIGFSCVVPPDGLVNAAASGTCMSVEARPTQQSGIMRAGAVDLTGDGIPETVQMDGDNVLISSEDDVVAMDDRLWRGLPDWQVVDIAVGDPNDDGRAELLLALFKPDQDGVVRSHPFVLGFREGTYRILWGGSAVSEPIHEIELGDVDGDGVQELVVLEEASAIEAGAGRTESTHLKAVTIWDWRSPSGRYRNLVLTPSENGSPPVINVTVEP